MTLVREYCIRTYDIVAFDGRPQRHADRGYYYPTTLHYYYIFVRNCVDDIIIIIVILETRNVTPRFRPRSHSIIFDRVQSNVNGPTRSINFVRINRINPIRPNEIHDVFGRGTRVVGRGNRTPREQAGDKLLSGAARSAPAVKVQSPTARPKRRGNHMDRRHVAGRLARDRRVRVLLGDLRTRTEKNHNAQ